MGKKSVVGSIEITHIKQFIKTTIHREIYLFPALHRRSGGSGGGDYEYAKEYDHQSTGHNTQREADVQTRPDVVRAGVLKKKLH